MGEHGDDERRRERGLVALALAAVVLIGGLIAVAVARDDDGHPAASGSGNAAAVTGPTDGRTATSTTTTTTRPPSTTASTTTTSLVIPPSTGRFTAAPTAGTTAGTGAVHTYTVEVEDGAGIVPTDFAATVEQILADPRGWTADRRTAFRRVASGGSFTITLATPDTTDAICLPLHTNNKFSCHEGHHIVINLRRWLEGTVDLPGSIADYRANVINHEVGHELGHGHVGCPGPGLHAPVMMQQSKGLHGCLPNPWPTLDGT